MQHRIRLTSTVSLLVDASLIEPAVAPASPVATERPLEHRESTEAARQEGRGERPEGTRGEDPMTWAGAPEAVSASEDVTAVDGPPWDRPASDDGVPVRRSHELLRIDGIPADSYPFLPTDRTVDVHVRRCRICDASSDRLRVHPRAVPPAQRTNLSGDETHFVEWLCKRCAT